MVTWEKSLGYLERKGTSYGRKGTLGEKVPGLRDSKRRNFWKRHLEEKPKEKIS